MTHKSYLVAAAIAVVAGTSALATHSAQAEPAGGIITVVCPATGPGIAVCAVVGTGLYELVQIANGKEGFGPNGEIMKVLAVPVKIVDGNIRAASGERGEIDKVIRAVTGISVRDINKYGIFGGPNSVFRKPFG
jgi:hypothetical protein